MKLEHRILLADVAQYSYGTSTLTGRPLSWEAGCSLIREERGVDSAEINSNHISSRSI